MTSITPTGTVVTCQKSINVVNAENINEYES